MKLMVNMFEAQKALSHVFSSLTRTTPANARHVSTNKPRIQVHRTPLARSFSSISGSNFSTGTPGNLRAFPQYTIHGENLLAIKIMPPGFKLVKNSIITLDAQRKGRILLEFAPRGVDGRYSWDEIIRFGLSAEEVGLLINQLPHYKVEFSRLPSARGGASDGEDFFQAGVVSNDMPEKVLIVEPGKLGAIDFTIDFVKDGVGGQSPIQGESAKGGPICVPVQAGEFEVISNLLSHSLPYLTGWAQTMDISMRHALSIDTSGGGTGGGGGGGDVPF